MDALHSWSEIAFGGIEPLWLGQEVARAAVVFVYGLCLVRGAGRRVFGKWSALDIIVSIIVGSALARAITGGIPFWGTLATTTLLMAMHAIVAQAVGRSRRVADLVEGRPIRIGSDGAIDRDALRRHAVSENDLHEALRASGLENVMRTRLIVVEPSGKITVLKAG